MSAFTGHVPIAMGILSFLIATIKNRRQKAVGRRQTSMIRICYSNYHIGDRKFGEKEPLEDKRETHGLCEPCLEKEIKIIEGSKQKAEGRNP